MFALSLILEDGAIYELNDASSQRSTALFMVASSYVTWTWQMHTFSNSVETIVVLWSLVMIRRLKARHSSNSAMVISNVLRHFCRPRRRLAH